MLPPWSNRGQHMYICTINMYMKIYYLGCDILISYFNSIYIDKVIYSIDMVRLKLDFSSDERIKLFGNYLCDVKNIHIEKYPISFKDYSYRNLFKINCSNGNSFVCGLSLNGKDKASYYLGFLEFNPNKVADQLQFKDVWGHLMIHCFVAEVIRWDLAIDVPISRDMCILNKDKRKYTLVKKSENDKTEYLGSRNKNGFCKLYNKKIESELDYELSRLEITVAGDYIYSDFLKILPRIDVRGDQQFINPYVELSGTDIVLYELLMKCDIFERKLYFKKLGRRKQESLKKYIFSNVYDSDKFVVSRSVFAQLRRQLREWTIGFDYSLLDDIDG